MAYSHYDRLSALDATFLEIESPNVHMHVGTVGIFAAGALHNPDGGLDIERIRALAEPALRENARFRQRSSAYPLRPLGLGRTSASTSTTTCATPACRSPAICVS
jgi:hypothetical protein